MALKETQRMKRFTGSGGGSLTASQDESYRIRRIYCNPSTNDTYLTLIVESTTIGKIRVKGLSGNHVPYPAMQLSQAYEAVATDIFALAEELGFDMSIPVASGETFKIERYAEAGDVTVVYDVYDAGDVKPTEPNGSKSNIRRYIHYATNSSAATSSPVKIDQSLIWSGGPQWPFDGLGVAEKNVYRIRAILGCPCAGGDGSANKGYTTHLQLIHRNNYLFDVDRNGIPFLGDSSATADTTAYKAVASLIGPMTAEHPKPPLILEPPLEYDEGETLTVQVVVGGAAADGIEANEIDIAFLMEHEYLTT